MVAGIPVLTCIVYDTIVHRHTHNGKYEAMHCIGRFWGADYIYILHNSRTIIILGKGQIINMIEGMGRGGVWEHPLKVHGGLK